MSLFHFRTMDQQYMQTSSQLYVFSTRWANRSAEAVMKEQFPTIISWHESQPETKHHLEVSWDVNWLPSLHIYIGAMNFSWSHQYVIFIYCSKWHNDTQTWPKPFCLSSKCVMDKCV